MKKLFVKKLTLSALSRIEISLIRFPKGGQNVIIQIVIEKILFHQYIIKYYKTSVIDRAIIK